MSTVKAFIKVGNGDLFRYEYEATIEAKDDVTLYKICDTMRSRYERDIVFLPYAHVSRRRSILQMPGIDLVTGDYVHHESLLQFKCQ